jgi:hypothetical protein
MFSARAEREAQSKSDRGAAAGNAKLVWRSRDWVLAILERAGLSLAQRAVRILRRASRGEVWRRARFRGAADPDAPGKALVRLPKI